MKTVFDPTYQPYASNRFCVTARNGMVSTGNALASAAGLEILRKGGNAVDAAIATAATLTVVEPTANGLGSDAFAICWMNNQLYGMNSSGYAPNNISREKVLEKHPDGKIPTVGWTPITVPGAPKAWARLNERFGKLSLLEDLEPAIRYATEGYALSASISENLEEATRLYNNLIKDKPEFAEWFRVFTNNGESYHFGDIIKLPDHAKTLELIGKTNADAFYKGEVADQIVKQSNRDGGYFSKEDLEEYDVKWVDPIGVEYHGYKVWEIPPNGQGIVALMALNILKEFKFDQKDHVDTYHKQFEAIKMAFADALKYVTDPDCMPFDYHDLITPEYGRKRALEMNLDKAEMPKADMPFKSGTVYLCTADKDGNMVSYIQSNYMGFGSGIVVEGYGVALQNRGHDFSLDENHYNVLMPRKRTYHTIIPGFITNVDGTKPVAPFGVMGAYMQPQGHVQVAMNFIDFKLNPQMALDAPRWQWIKGKDFLVEPSFRFDIVKQLIKKGHYVNYANSVASFGRGQMIVRLDNGVLVGGCESRTDSNIACY